MRDVAVGCVGGGVHPSPHGGGALGDEPGQGAPSDEFGRPRPRDGRRSGRGRGPGLGVTLTTIARRRRACGREGQGGARRARPPGTRATAARRPPVHAEDLRTRVHLPRKSRAPHHSTRVAARFNARPPARPGGRTPAMGRSANLNAHPFGGGVIGNTTGSGPVIEGSSPSPRAPAALHTCHGDHRSAPSSRGLGHHPLKVATRVRIPLGLLCGLDPIWWTAVMTMRPAGCGLSVDPRIRSGSGSSGRCGVGPCCRSSRCSRPCRRPVGGLCANFVD